MMYKSNITNKWAIVVGAHLGYEAFSPFDGDCVILTLKWLSFVCGVVEEWRGEGVKAKDYLRYRQDCSKTNKSRGCKVVSEGN